MNERYIRALEKAFLSETQTPPDRRLFGPWKLLHGASFKSIYTVLSRSQAPHRMLRYSAQPAVGFDEPSRRWEAGLIKVTGAAPTAMQELGSGCQPQSNTYPQSCWISRANGSCVFLGAFTATTFYFCFSMVHILQNNLLLSWNLIFVAPIISFSDLA